jgi:hypothetical protein
VVTGALVDGATAGVGNGRALLLALEQPHAATSSTPLATNARRVSTRRNATAPVEQLASSEVPRRDRSPKRIRADSDALVTITRTRHASKLSVMRLPKVRSDPTRSSKPDPERYFFVHIMKTGGTTFLQQLLRNFAPEEVYPNHELDFDAEHFLKHLSVEYLLSLSEERRQTIRVYAGHFPYVATEMLDLDLVTLTVLREPVARAVSLLQQLKHNGPRHQLSTLDQIYADPLVFVRLASNHQTKIFCTRADDQPVNFRNEIEIDADRFALAKRNLAQVDVLGFTEQFDAFLDELERRFGWHFDRELRANSTSGIEDASSDLRRRIAEDNQLDLELYEYARSLMKEKA